MKAVFLLLCVLAYVAASPDGECPRPDGEEPTYLADSAYCAKYYECSNGHAFPFICPRGTYWDKEGTGCSDDVDCGSLRTTPAV
ncbi:hypothetical protein JTB14_036641 [Gonioctena quinquepunctata]|nr:hypothetical protein JTB14_036641 [Gonioctena quinquepunctata]